MSAAAIPRPESGLSKFPLLWMIAQAQRPDFAWTDR